MQTDELALFVKRADSYLANMYGLHMEFVHPDVVQIVEKKVVTCKMVALEFQDIMVKDVKVRILVLRDEQGLLVVASHPYDLGLQFQAAITSSTGRTRLPVRRRRLPVR